MFHQLSMCSVLIKIVLHKLHKLHIKFSGIPVVNHSFFYNNNYRYPHFMLFLYHLHVFFFHTLLHTPHSFTLHHLQSSNLNAIHSHIFHKTKHKPHTYTHTHKTFLLFRRGCFTSEFFKGCVDTLQMSDEIETFKSYIKQLNGGQAPALKP